MNRKSCGHPPPPVPAAARFGAFSRSQARAEGFTADQIDYRVATGRWEAVYPGVYRVAGAPVTFRQRVHAAVLWAGGGAVVSHRAAARLWHLDGIRSRVAEVTVDTHRRVEGVVVHRSRRLPEVDVTGRYGLSVTTVARTLVDLASVVDAELLQTAAEDALRRGLVSEARLGWRLDEIGRGRPGAGRLRALLEARDGPALESRLEVRFEALLRRRDLPVPQRQRQIRDAGGRCRVDFAYPDAKVVVECVGWRHHGGKAAWRRDVARRRRLAAQGWRVLEFTWAEVSWDPDLVVADLADALGYSDSEPPSSYSA